MRNVKANPTNIPNDPPARMSRDQAAAYLGLSASSLSADVVTRRLQIPRIQAGRRCIYDRVQLDRWMSERAVNVPTAANA